MGHVRGGLHHCSAASACCLRARLDRFDAGHVTPPVAAPCPIGLARKAARRVDVAGVVDALDGLGVRRAGTVAAHQDGEPDEVALRGVRRDRHAGSIASRRDQGYGGDPHAGIGSTPRSKAVSRTQQAGQLAEAGCGLLRMYQAGKVATGADAVDGCVRMADRARPMSCCVRSGRSLRSVRGVRSCCAKRLPVMADAVCARCNNDARNAADFAPGGAGAWHADGGAHGRQQETTDRPPSRRCYGQPATRSDATTRSRDRSRRRSRCRTAGRRRRGRRALRR